jgi:hypothetical protein
MRSWILMPKEVLVETSVDGLNFKLMGNTTNTIADTAKHNILSNMEVNFAPTKARYIRVKAINYGKLPNGIREQVATLSSLSMKLRLNKCFNIWFCIWAFPAKKGRAGLSVPIFLFVPLKKDFHVNP